MHNRWNAERISFNSLILNGIELNFSQSRLQFRVPTLNLQSNFKENDF